MRFPSVTAYLDTLPEGIDSYPGVSVKGSVVRAALAEVPEKLPMGAGLPTEVERLVREPPALSGWASEVHFNAMMLAIYDLSFAAEGIHAYERWAYEGNKRLLQGPLYRILFMVLSPERLLVGIQRRWSAFRRGTVLEAVDAGKGRATFRLVYPAHLFSELARLSLRAAFRVAVETAGAKLVHVEKHDETSSSTRYEVRWH